MNLTIRFPKGYGSARTRFMGVQNKICNDICRNALLKFQCIKNNMINVFSFKRTRSPVNSLIPSTSESVKQEDSKSELMQLISDKSSIIKVEDIDVFQKAKRKRKMKTERIDAMEESLAWYAMLFLTFAVKIWNMNVL